MISLGGRDQPFTLTAHAYRFPVIAVLALALPGTAAASTLTLDGGTLTYTASAGRANSVSVGTVLGNVSIAVGDNDLFAVANRCNV